MIVASVSGDLSPSSCPWATPKYLNIELYDYLENQSLDDSRVCLALEGPQMF